MKNQHEHDPHLLKLPRRNLHDFFVTKECLDINNLLILKDTREDLQLRVKDDVLGSV